MANANGGHYWRKRNNRQTIPPRGRYVQYEGGGGGGGTGKMPRLGPQKKHSYRPRRLGELAVLALWLQWVLGWVRCYSGGFGGLLAVLACAVGLPR
jgi:hypothetical protein